MTALAADTLTAQRAFLAEQIGHPSEPAVIEIDEAFLRKCAGRHRKSAGRPIRGCACGRTWCGVHASALDNYACPVCRRTTVLLADRIVKVAVRA